MIQIIICAIVTCLATMGSAFGVMTWKAAGAADKAAEKVVEVVSAKTRMISVPIISENAVQGYVIARFEFIADAERLKKTKVELESIISDEAFKVIYGSVGQDFSVSRKTDVADVTSSVKDGVNKRWAEPLVKDVLIDSWSFLKNREMAKTHE